VLRRKVGPFGEEWSGQRELHNEELHNVCSLPDIIIMVRSVDYAYCVHEKI
jgi:hypothetical protein